MAAKKSTKAGVPANHAPRECHAERHKGSDTGEQRRAAAAARPHLRAPAAGYAYAQPVFGKDLDIIAYADELEQQAAKVVRGDISAIETMLVHQANTLDMIFNRLALKAANCEYLNQMEAHLRQALRAQAQCRATLETLAEIRNPRPISYVRQANIANGPQQVNNGVPPAACSRASSANQPNELLEVTNGERLDTGAAQAAGRGNPTVEAVGQIHRAGDAGGYGRVLAEWAQAWDEICGYAREAKGNCATAALLPGAVADSALQLTTPWPEKRGAERALRRRYRNALRNGPRYKHRSSKKVHRRFLGRPMGFDGRVRPSGDVRSVGG